MSRIASWKNSISIHAPADQVFAYVDEPMNYPTWLPNMVEVRNVIGEGIGQQYEWTFKMGGLLHRGQTVIVEYVPHKSASHQIIGNIDALWEYDVEPQDEGTLLTIGVEYSVPIPVLGRLAEHIVVRELGRQFDVALQNVKDVMEA